MLDVADTPCGASGGGSDCAVPRFSLALLGAFALQGVSLLVRAGQEASAQRVPDPPAEQWIDIDDPQLGNVSPTLPAPPAPPAAADEADSLSRAPSARLARNEPRAASSSQLPSVADAPAANDSAVAGVTVPGQGEAAAAEPERKIDLGLDGHFFLGPPSEMLPRVRSESKPRIDPQKRLENA